MSSGNYIQLYSLSSKPDEVFFLEQGKVFFFVSETDKYAIDGKNIIIGSTEVILNKIMKDD